MENRLICICGPTASGKTALSVALAQQLHTEIISADSMQLYREMDIGTAKPTPEEMRGVPHHMIDVADPGEDFSAARYVEMASACVDGILARGRLPIVAGGTGLYIDSLLSGRTFAAFSPDSPLRGELEAELARRGGAAMLEELARVDGGAGVILSAHVSLGSWPIFAYGTEEQKRKYLVPLAKGEKIGAFGLTEPNAGSDAGGTETTAVLKGDHYVLNGGKIFITNAPKADTYVVFAVTTPDIGTRGISAFIVEKGWKGFYFGDHYDKMGIRSSSTAELIFDNVEVPRENLLGKEGDGFKIAMSTLDGGRIGIAAQALGIARDRQTNLEGWAAPKMEAYIAKKQKLEKEQNK